MRTLASDPVLHLLAGSNGAGKSTFVARVLQPVTLLLFVNADVIAAERWPESTAEHAYDASRLAAEERDRLLDARSSFITETVFSHSSKVDLVRSAVDAGYLVRLHVILVPEDVTVLRVGHRVRSGGHDVPEGKIRERYARLWDLVVEARGLVHRAEFYDNSSARTPFRLVATYDQGLLVGSGSWPSWAPAALTAEAGEPPDKMPR